MKEIYLENTYRNVLKDILLSSNYSMPNTKSNSLYFTMRLDSAKAAQMKAIIDNFVERIHVSNNFANKANDLASLIVSQSK